MCLHCCFNFSGLYGIVRGPVLNHGSWTLQKDPTGREEGFNLVTSTLPQDTSRKDIQTS